MEVLPSLVIPTESPDITSTLPLNHLKEYSEGTLRDSVQGVEVEEGARLTVSITIMCSVCRVRVWRMYRVDQYNV